ncbi:MAG TPA: SpoIIE family protein phosphatase [Spirochaetota bacterium]|nr:SpoIIE family protein phosphatase [Spirochaetota bacterium]HPN82267.1 SpoIIE family protein phosphatase [Spirochaetota bacterium]
MGIGFKLGMFVAVVLSLVMLVTGVFIVRQQETVLDNQLRRDLSSHLKSFSMAVTASLSGKEDLPRLQSSTYALSNINNFGTAMFVDPRGRVFAQVDRSGVPFDGRYAVVTMPIPKLDDPELAARYPDIGYLLSDMVDGTNIIFARSSRYTSEEYAQVLAESASNKTPPPVNTAWFEGFLPVCVNWLQQVHPGDNSLDKALALYRAGVTNGFLFRGVQNDQRRRDLAFLRHIETVARWLAVEKLDPWGNRVGWELSPYAKMLGLREKDRLTETESWQIAAMIPLIEGFRKGESAGSPEKLFPRETITRITSLVERYFSGAAMPDGLGGLLTDARAGKLLMAGVSPGEEAEIRMAADWLEVARALTRSSGPEWNKVYGEMAAARQIAPFVHGDEIFVDIALFAGLFEAYLTGGEFPMPETHRYRKLSRIYEPKKSPEERAAFVRHMLRSLVTPFKFGYVRIILDPGAIRTETLGIVARTVDISLALVLRAVILSILLAGLFVRNIRKLARAAARVGQGDLETTIDIRSRDELGRLGHEFNSMVSRIRESRAALVEKSRMEEELRIAETIQKGLLPVRFPEIPGYAFAGYYSAQSEAGGDYYDILESSLVGGGRVGLVSADVSGHGVGAGLVMTMARTLFHAQAADCPDPARVLARMNPQLFRDTPPAIFVTAFYAILDTGTHGITWASAGHNPALCARAGGRVDRCTSDGLPLGMADGPTFDSIIAQGSSSLAIGDVFLLYTDGVTEAMNAEREEYGEERLADALKRASGLEPSVILDAIVADLAVFTGDLPQEDDISMLVVKRQVR